MGVPKKKCGNGSHRTKTTACAGGPHGVTRENTDRALTHRPAATALLWTQPLGMGALRLSPLPVATCMTEDHTPPAVNPELALGP